MNTSWLIEWPATRQDPLRYWHPTEGHVVDPNNAVRFCRQEDAEAMLKRDGLRAGARAVEHCWISDHPPSSVGGEGEAVAEKPFAWTWQVPTGRVWLNRLGWSNPHEHAGPVRNPRALYLHPSPEMGEISREELKTILDDKIFLRSLSPSEVEPGYTEGYGVFGLDNATDAILYKLKENGLSREGLGGDQPAPVVRGQGPNPVLTDRPLSDGGRGS